MIEASSSNESLPPSKPPFSWVRMVAAALLIFCVPPATFAVIRKKAKKPVAGPARGKALVRPSVAAGKRPSSKGKRRVASAAPDVSPQRGTEAAESVQATLAEMPAAPFLYAKTLDGFFRALDRLRKQTANPYAQTSVPALADTVRILQFGDSHTAADYFTGAVREQLQSRFGNGGLGFQFPGHPFAGYRLAGSSRGQSSGWYTQGNRFNDLGDGDLGLGGISISTSRAGESVTLETTCTTLQVEYLRQPGGGHLHFTDNGVYISDIDTGPTENQEAARGAGTMTYACTPGVHDFALTTLEAAPVKLLGLVTEQPGITYECLGINGAVAPLMLRWNQEIFADYLRQRAPNLIVLAYGTNEAAQSAAHNEDYLADLGQLVANLHRIVPHAAVLILGPYDRAMKTGRGRRASWHTFAGTDRIIADQKAVCREFHCAFYDARARQGGPGAMLRWVSAGLAQPDRTHLTGSGYRALAQAFYLDLLTAYKSWQAGQASDATSDVLTKERKRHG